MPAYRRRRHDAGQRDGKRKLNTLNCKRGAIFAIAPRFVEEVAGRTGE